MNVANLILSHVRVVQIDYERSVVDIHPKYTSSLFDAGKGSLSVWGTANAYSVAWER